MANSFIRSSSLPTPLAGLALGIGSLGWSLENTGLFSGMAALAGAIVSGCLLALLLIKFLSAPSLLQSELKHPVMGSILPTYSMALMLFSAAIGGKVGTSLWLLAVVLHTILLLLFFCIDARASGFLSWCPVGIFPLSVSLWPISQSPAGLGQEWRRACSGSASSVTPLCCLS